MKRRQYLAGIGAVTAATVVGVPSVAGDEHDDAIAHWDVPEGTDVGPGNYTYPTTDEIPEGEFDLAGFTIRSEDGEYHFTQEYHHGITNEWDGDYGFSHQLIQIYFHNPDADGGTIEAREGINATFEAPHHHRVVVSPFEDDFEPVVEDAEGNVVDEDVEVNTEDGDKITVSVDESTLDYLEDGAVAALSVGFDGYAEGMVRQVTEDGGEWEFAGAENEYAPNVIDLVTSDDVSSEDALAYSDGEYAEIPLLQVGDEEVDDDHDEEVDDPNGDDDEDHDDEDDHDEEDDHDDDDDANGEDDHDDDDEADDDGSPGFGIGAAIAGAAGGALAKKRLSDDEPEA